MSEKLVGTGFPSSGKSAGGGNVLSLLEATRLRDEQMKAKKERQEILKLANYDPEWTENEQGKPKLIKHPKTADAIWAHLGIMLPGVFKRMGNTPFCIVGDEIFVLDDSAKLYAMILKLGVMLLWSDGDALISKKEFFCFVGQHAEKFDLISELPCYPEMPGVFYSKKIAPEENGTLDHLIGLFNFATDVDRQLIKAMFMTPFWGGECGQRPAFLIDGLDSDKAGNRGIGKTTITDALVLLCGGTCVDLTSKTEGEDIRKRLLTAVKERVVRMDNIKAQSLSNETLESLITAKRVSGHQMFRGHNSIPNAFTYVLTFNDAVLSKDMSQRCIIIRLKRPQYIAEWWDGVTDFIETNRERIIADIGHMFAKDAPALPAASRFAKWERHVLGKCATDLAAVQASIKYDQTSVDDDSHLMEDIREVMLEKIAGIQWKFDGNGPVYFDPEKHTVAVNRAVVHGWLAPLFQKGLSSRYIAKRLQSAMPKEFLSEFKKHLGTRYLVWVGARSGAPNFEPKGCWRVEINGSTKITQWNFGVGAPDDAP